MKHRKLLSILLAAATAVSVAGCSKNENSSSGDVPADESAPSGEPVSPKVSENGWEFNQVAMGGGGFVSGVFATSQEGLYYARTDVGGAYRYNKDTQLWVHVWSEMMKPFLPTGI